MKKISAHTCITNPEAMGYPYLESIRSFANFCDEVVVVDGGSTDGSLEKIKEIPNARIVQGEKWERDFNWLVLCKNIEIGFEECKGDWAFHFDTDYIFREDEVLKLRKEVEECSFAAIEVNKTNFVLVNENYCKDYFALLVNKGQYQTVCYGIAKMGGLTGATFLRPIVRKMHTRNKDGMFEGEPLKMSEVRLQRSNTHIYTYDFTFMTKEQVIEQRVRFETSLAKYKGWHVPTPEESFEDFINMMKGRHQRCKEGGKTHLIPADHSKFIVNRVVNITPEMFGYNGWGLL